ncbi:MAG TPA: 50S ribosomal protein L24 [Candidatus Tectomicrobia bacterium]
MARAKVVPQERGCIKKDDFVKIIAGRDRGKQGKVLRVFPAEGRLTVERMNMVKRHTRPTRQMQQGGIIEREGKLHISNVMLICSKCERGVRIGHRILENEKKVRICRRCGELLDK